MDIVVAVLFVVVAATGASRSRRVAGLGVAAGVAWSAAAVNPALLFVHRPIAVHLVLAYPTGRLRDRAARATVAAFWVTAILPATARDEILTLALSGVLVATSFRARRRDGSLPAVDRLVGQQLPGAAATLLALGLALPAGLRLFRGVDGAAAASLAYSVAFAAALTLLVVDAVVAGAARDADAVLGLAQDGPELVLDTLRAEAASRPSRRHRQTLSAAADLLAANQELRHELDARTEQVRASRRRLADAADDERRRYGRLLREGTLSHLADVEATLTLLRTRRLRDGTGPVDRCLDNLATARQDLDRLLAGLAPVALDEHGLAGALSAVRVIDGTRLLVRCPAERFPPGVESVVWFVCSEAIVNADRHAAASRIEVTVRAEPGANGRPRIVSAEIVDDGRGGARPRPGGGLAGLADRVHAADGLLEVVSPPSGGTRVRLEVPLP
jgi:signal transduction histidine kinase